MAVTRKIAGPGRLGSAKAVKDSTKKSAGMHPKVKIIPAEGSITVRFLEEPSDWFGFYEYFDEGYFPLLEGQTLPDGVKASFRYLANAYIVDDSKVMAVKMPKTLVELLMGYYDKRSTILDRDYELSRTGSGALDTKYLASPDSPTKMNTARLKIIDIGSILEDMASGADDADDDEEEDVPVRRGSKSRAQVDDEDDDDPWADDDDEEEDEPAPRRAVKKSAPARRTVVKKAPVRKSVRRTR